MCRIQNNLCICWDPRPKDDGLFLTKLPFLQKWTPDLSVTSISMQNVLTVASQHGQHRREHMMLYKHFRGLQFFNKRWELFCFCFKKLFRDKERDLDEPGTNRLTTFPSSIEDLRLVTIFGTWNLLMATTVWFAISNSPNHAQIIYFNAVESTPRQLECDIRDSKKIK